MRYELLIFAFILMLLTACATGPHEKERASVPPETGVEAETQQVKKGDSTCIEPSYLVRDLTVPWAQRSYLVGPCDGEHNQDSSTHTKHDATRLPTSVDTVGAEGEKKR